MKKTKTKVLKILLVFALAITLIRGLYAIPPPASEFYGTVTVNDSDALLGTNVSAYDPDNILCGYFIVQNSGFYGSISCNGDDSSTDEDEGASEGDTITFYVNGSRAIVTGNATWDAGRYQFVNLSAKNYPPAFDHNLTTQYINESSAWIYDVNCSDPNNDTLTYYDNATVFDINPSTGVINWTPDPDELGSYPVLITCGDGELNVSGTLLIFVLDVNNAPVLDSIGSLIAIENQLFTHDVDATDADENDTLTYYANSTLFTINSSTGLVNFTPSLAEVGNYTINFSVTDGLLWDYEIVFFRIARGPYCGDGICYNEDCGTCPQDCGACPQVPALPAPESAAPGPAGIGQIGACIEKWECSEWTICAPEGYQTRRCADIYGCGTTKKKPPEVQECVYLGTCEDGLQNCHDGACEEAVDCGGPCDPCPAPPSCFDGIKNCHDEACEEGIDCGGTCLPCEERKPAERPIEKLAPLVKRFPWLLLFLIIILITMTIGGDHLYVQRIRKGEFEKYKAQLRLYRKIRNQVYVVASVLALTGLLYTIYIYALSNKPELMDEYLWVPMAFTFLIIFVSFLVFRHFKYYEYKKRKEEQLFLLQEKQRKRKLVATEDEILILLETKALRRLNYMMMHKEVKEDDLLAAFSDATSLLKGLIRDRNGNRRPIETQDDVKAVIKGVINQLNLTGLVGGYPEFKDVITPLKVLSESTNKESPEVREDVELLLLSIITVARDLHLMSIIKSNEALTDLYNKLVEIYDYYNKLIGQKESEEKQLADEENKFMRGVEDLTKKPKTLELIRQSEKYAVIYNSLVDLYNHYKRRQEIANELKQMEKSK
jgi:hypothetical protein